MQKTFNSMVVENATLIPEYLINEIANLTTLFKAVGGLVIAYIVFSIVNTIWNRKKRNELREMRKLLVSIEKSVSELNKKIKKKK